MTPEILRDHIAKLSVETVDQLTERDIHELSDAAEAAILAGGGFGWLSPPPKSVMERSEERRVGKECRSRWSPYH